MKVKTSIFPATARLAGKDILVNNTICTLMALSHCHKTKLFVETMYFLYFLGGVTFNKC